MDAQSPRNPIIMYGDVIVVIIIICAFIKITLEYIICAECICFTVIGIIERRQAAYPM